MDPITLAFLLVGAAGVMMLLIAVVVGDLAHLGGPDVDGPFSFPAIAAFVGSAGFFGAIPAAVIGTSLPTGATVAISTTVGVLAAIPVAWLAIRFSAALLKMRTDPTLTENDLSAALGVVVSAIPAGGFGEVRLRLHGQDLKYAARAPGMLPAGTPVFVTDVLSPTAVEVVSTADTLHPPDLAPAPDPRPDPRPDTRES